MGSLKLPHSLSRSHSSPIHPHRTIALPNGCITSTTIQLFTPNILPFEPHVFKGELRFSRRSTSASVQPATEQLKEDESKDPLVSGDSLRHRFLDSYASRGHKVLRSASLLPDVPTVLLRIAGMLQFKPMFLGKAILIECMDDTDADALKNAAEYLIGTLQDPAAVVLG